MLRYAINRIFLMIPTLLGVAVLVFLVLRVVPGDIVEVKLTSEGGLYTEEQIQAERERLGLADPLPTQFVRYMWGLAHGDLGISLWTERPVLQEIGGRIGLTVELAIISTLLAVMCWKQCRRFVARRNLMKRPPRTSTSRSNDSRVILPRKPGRASSIR